MTHACWSTLSSESHKVLFPFHFQCPSRSGDPAPRRGREKPCKGHEPLELPTAALPLPPCYRFSSSTSQHPALHTHGTTPCAALALQPLPGLNSNDAVSRSHEGQVRTGMPGAVCQSLSAPCHDTVFMKEVIQKVWGIRGDLGTGPGGCLCFWCCKTSSLSG